MDDRQLDDRLDDEVERWVGRGYKIVSENEIETIVQNEHGRRMRLGVDDDGTVWSEEVPGPRVAVLPWLLVASAVLVAVGSFGPWAKVLFATKNGTDGDGVITLVLAVVAGAIALLRLSRPGDVTWLKWLMVLAFGAAAAVGVYDWNDVSSTSPVLSTIKIEVGWGLQLTTIAAACGLVLSLVHALRGDA